MCSGKCLAACYDKFPSSFKNPWENFQSANTFSWQFPWCEFLSFMSLNQCKYGHSWMSCSCLYLEILQTWTDRGFKEHRRPEFLSCAGVVNGSHVSIVFPFRVVVQELIWKTFADLSRKKRDISVWVTYSVLISTQKSYQWDFWIKLLSLVTVFFLVTLP